VTGILIVLVALAASAVVWAALLRRPGGKEATAPIPFLMRVPVPWVFLFAYLVGVAIGRVVPLPVTGAAARVAWWAGVALVAGGLVLAVSALGLFRRSHTTTIPFHLPSTFVTTGPYRFTRNPMYLGLTLVYLGVAGTRAELWPVAVLPVVLIYVNFMVIPFEEQRLVELFGDLYRQYRAIVRRWL